MTNITELRREAREIEDFFREPWADERTPAELVRAGLRDVRDCLQMPTEKELPDVASLDLIELARLSGLTPEEIRHFVETTRPVDGADVEVIPDGWNPRAYFCDKLDDDARRIGLLVAVPKGVRWRVYDLPLILYRKAHDAVHSNQDTWESFVRTLDEYLVGVLPDAYAAQDALKEFSKPSDPSFESLVAAAAVNFRLSRRTYANAVSLFSLAGLKRGYSLQSTIRTFVSIETEGAPHARMSGRNSGNSSKRSGGTSGNLERSQ